MIWRPDTCACVLEYDGGNQAENFVRVVKACRRHDGAVDPHDAVLAQNQWKNRTLHAVALADPTLAVVIRDARGEDTGERVWDDALVRFRFEDEKLIVEVPAGRDKSVLRDAVKGLGDVEIV